MNKPSIFYILKCKFCSTQTGEIELPADEWEGKEITDEMLGVADSRCDSCTILHGIFND